MKKLLSLLLLLLIIPGALATTTDDAWEQVLNNEDRRLAATKESENGLWMLVYANDDDIFNLIFLPRDAMQSDPVVQFISAAIVSGGEMLPLEFSQACFSNQGLCHDDEHLRIQLTPADIRQLPGSDSIEFRFQSEKSLVDKRERSVSVSLEGFSVTIEHLVATGHFLRNKK